MNLSTIRTNVLNSLYKGQGNTTKSLAYRNCLALVGLYLAKDLYSHFNIAHSLKSYVVSRTDIEILVK